jgi:hypothetical protein
LSFFQGNVIKYVVRYKDKNGIEDLKKIIHYCELEIEEMRNENKTIVGYYWDGTNHYIIYEDDHGNTKMVLDKSK